MQIKNKHRIAFYTIIILILGLIVFVLFYWVRGLQQEFNRTVSREYCEQNFNEDDYLRVSVDSLEGQPYYKFQLCYENYFWPTNKNWVSLETILFNKHSVYPPSSVTLRDEPKEQEMRVIAKQLEQKGLNLWDIAELRMAYGAPGKHDYRKWEGYPFIMNDKYVVGTLLETAAYDIPPQHLYPDMPNMGIIPDGIYTAESEEVREIKKYDGHINTWSTDRTKTILLAVEVRDGQPTAVLKTYETQKPQINNKPYGPYLIKLTGSEWFRFNSDLTLCETVNLMKIGEEYQFISNACTFDENGILTLSAH